MGGLKWAAQPPLDSHTTPSVCLPAAASCAAAASCRGVCWLLPPLAFEQLWLLGWACCLSLPPFLPFFLSGEGPGAWRLRLHTATGATCGSLPPAQACKACEPPAPCPCACRCCRPPARAGACCSVEALHTGLPRPLARARLHRRALTRAPAPHAACVCRHMRRTYAPVPKPCACPALGPGHACAALSSPRAGLSRRKHATARTEPAAASQCPRILPSC